MAAAPAQHDPEALAAQQQEYERLADLLASMPTAEWQDQQLLQSGSLQGWQQQLLVQFRLQRKRALRLALEWIENSWAAQQANLTGACLQAGNGSSGSSWPAGQGDGCPQTFLPLLECPALELRGQGLASVLLEATGIFSVHGGFALGRCLLSATLVLALAVLLLKPWAYEPHPPLSVSNRS